MILVTGCSDGTLVVSKGTRYMCIYMGDEKTLENEKG